MYFSEYNMFGLWITILIMVPQGVIIKEKSIVLQMLLCML